VSGLKQPTPAEDDPRLDGHRTEYRASRGGYYPVQPKPVPGTPRKAK
jgi:hypothetical protein